MAVAVSVITTFTSPYMIRFSEPASKHLESVLPEKWKNTLTTYSIDAQQITEISDWKRVLNSSFINVVIFSVIIITLIVLSTQYLAPIFSGHRWNKISIAIFTLVVLSPFLWALAFRRTQRQAYANVWLKNAHRGPLILLQFLRIALAVFYIGFLFDSLFSPLVALICAIISCLILALFSKRIKAFYGKIELRFLANFNEREEKAAEANEILTPWDTHITTFELTPQSPYIGKTLEESRMRETFGVNIVVIERGDFVINVPTRDTHLYPDDKLSVIGTDEQLEKFKLYLESSVRNSKIPETHQNVSLHHFTLNENSNLAGKNIRESGIRERSRGLIVGIERNGERTVNPKSDFVFKMGDIVWIVGNEKRIQVIIKESAT